jgi:hypothetical protein
MNNKLTVNQAVRYVCAKGCDVLDTLLLGARWAARPPW